MNDLPPAWWTPLVRRLCSRSGRVERVARTLMVPHARLANAVDSHCGKFGRRHNCRLRGCSAQGSPPVLYQHLGTDHAASDGGTTERSAVLLRRVPRDTLGSKYQPRRMRVATPRDCLHCVDHPFGAHMPGHRPSHHSARTSAGDHREVYPGFAGPAVGGVRNPALSTWPTLKFRFSTIRVRAPAEVDEARRARSGLVDHYNNRRLHGPVGYVVQADSSVGYVVQADSSPDTSGRSGRFETSASRRWSRRIGRAGGRLAAQDGQKVARLVLVTSRCCSTDHAFELRFWDPQMHTGSPLPQAGEASRSGVGPHNF